MYVRYFESAEEYGYGQYLASALISHRYPKISMNNSTKDDSASELFDVEDSSDLLFLLDFCLACWESSIASSKAPNDMTGAHRLQVIKTNRMNFFIFEKKIMPGTGIEPARRY